jgi:hypothetical protein
MLVLENCFLNLLNARFKEEAAKVAHATAAAAVAPTESAPAQSPRAVALAATAPTLPVKDAVHVFQSTDGNIHACLSIPFCILCAMRQLHTTPNDVLRLLSNFTPLVAETMTIPNSAEGESARTAHSFTYFKCAFSVYVAPMAANVLTVETRPRGDGCTFTSMLLTFIVDVC